MVLQKNVLQNLNYGLDLSDWEGLDLRRLHLAGMERVESELAVLIAWVFRLLIVIHVDFHQNLFVSGLLDLLLVHRA